jgi:heterodisulfide reductase subunit A
MMAYGFAESYFTRARSAGVTFIRYSLDQKPAVEAGPSELKVLAREPILGRPIEIEADLVILATGVIPNLPRDLAESFGAGLDRDGFFQEAESKWRPVDSLKEGVFACGLSHSPRNITETIATAEAAAERALRILSRERVQAGSVVATVHHSLCSLCERCIDACPYGARALDADNEQVAVNPVMCQGCGACAAVCPNSASTLEGFNDQQMLEVIDAAIG